MEQKDEALIGNEKIEEYVAMLQQEPTEEMFAVVLSTVRRRMNAGGQFIVAVDATAAGDFQIQAMQLPNGEKWLPAYTSFEEQMMGNMTVMSTFMADIGQILDIGLNEDSLAGVIINPWNRTLKLDKDLIRLIKKISD